MGDRASQGETLEPIVAAHEEVLTHTQTPHLFTTLRSVAATLTANLDPRSLVQEILSVAVETLGAARGILFLGRGTEESLVPVATVGLRGEELEKVERASRAILRRCRRGPVLVAEDAADGVDGANLLDAHTVLCAPLSFRKETTGVIYLDAPATANAIVGDARLFLEALAELAGVALENARRHGEVIRENTRLRRELTAQQAFSGVVTLSPRLRVLLERAALAARVDAPILIRGESGSGKELLARAIHSAGQRSLLPFVSCDCTAVPRELMESLLFGHAKGAFRGAQRETRGFFREADRGVLFLAEITEVDRDCQVKLLDVIRDGVVSPAGGQREFRVDVHLIAATSRDPRALVREGHLLEDLYYRLSVIELSIPPLRERSGDIPLLVDHFVRKHSPDFDGPPPVTFTPDALEFLQALPWRDNVRELESLVRRILVLSPYPTVDIDELEAVLSVGQDSPEYNPEWLSGEHPIASREGLVRPLAEQERDAIQDALVRTGGNQSKAARLLGVHRNTLLRRIRKLGIHIAT